MMQKSIRAFVLVLSLAGLASTVSIKAAKGNSVSAPHTSVNIIPTCGSNDPNRCGLD